MNWKFSANAAFFGLQRNRFTQYQPDRTLEEKFALAAQVKGLEGIELRYPKDFEDLKDATYFRYGALSAWSVGVW